MKLWDWWVKAVDKVLPPPRPTFRLTPGNLRYNLEMRAPGGFREGARMQLTNAQCMDLLAILNKLEGK